MADFKIKAQIDEALFDTSKAQVEYIMSLNV